MSFHFQRCATPDTLSFHSFILLSPSSLASEKVYHLIFIAVLTYINYFHIYICWMLHPRHLQHLENCTPVYSSRPAAVAWEDILIHLPPWNTPGLEREAEIFVYWRRAREELCVRFFPCLAGSTWRSAWGPRSAPQERRDSCQLRLCGGGGARLDHFRLD